MNINPKHVQATVDIAGAIQNFLPASPHPYADEKISFPGCAAKLGLAGLWRGGSKRSAVSMLLRDTIERERSKFCPLILEIVMTGLVYRASKKDPITREEITNLNQLLLGVEFKIPELWDRAFLSRLPSKNGKLDEGPQPAGPLGSLLREYVDLALLDPIKRGYAFQDFLNRVFSANHLEPKSAFRQIGEEIDGSFELGGVTYLVEAKWQNLKSGQKDMGAFSIKVGGKSTWARGLFISFVGFTKDGLEAFARGKQTNIIGMDGQDLYFILEGKLKLDEAIRLKARRAAETNEFFVSVFELANTI